MRSCSEVIGWILTVLWVLLVGVFISLKRDDFLSMSFDTFGSFLSGITAPLAFVWLIVGYFLQRKELKENTEALQRQEQELQKQAEAMTAQKEQLAQLVKAKKFANTITLNRSN